MASVARYFASSYGFSRKAFLDAAKSVKAHLESHQNTQVNGPRDEPLYTDVARLGPPPGDAKTVLIMTSAIHGVEGFTGSGIQAGLLREEINARMPETMALVMIHGVNPHGFAHIRRVTEGNVDLNRNMLDHAGGHPDDSAYAAVHDVLCPPDLGTSLTSQDDPLMAALDGPDGPAIQAAITGGQWRTPEGLFFGGQAPVWSNTMLRTLCAAHAAGAEHVCFLDLHTGLGPYGYGELMGTPTASGALDRARSWFGDEVTSPQGGPKGGSTSAPVSGYVAMLWEDLDPQVPCTPITLEYGTRDLATVLNALRLDNWLHVHGDPDSPQGRDIKARLLDAFYPDDPVWKERVFERAMDVTERAIVGLKGMSVP